MVSEYVESMNANNLGNEIRIEEVRYNHRRIDTEKAVNILVAGEKKITAILFATNALTISGLYCVKKLIVRIPEDLAIIGLDGN